MADDLTETLAAWHVEKRAGIPVLVFADGSCRPATDAEAVLWSAVENVLAIEPETDDPDSWDRGYNAAIRAVRKALTDALGLDS